jgi:hypothetical protein
MTFGDPHQKTSQRRLILTTYRLALAVIDITVCEVVSPGLPKKGWQLWLFVGGGKLTLAAATTTTLSACAMIIQSYRPLGSVLLDFLDTV